MDGTRMGSRSSTRHGPAAVFSGPVRRWRKAWAPVSSSSSSASTSSSSSRVLLYKWVPLTAPGGKDEVPEEPTVPTVRYMPVSIILAQRKEASRRASEEVEETVDKNGDASEEPEVQAEPMDHNMVSPEIKELESIGPSQASNPTAVEERGQLANTSNGTHSEERVDSGNTPTERDVPMTDKEQDEVEEVKPEKGPSGFDLESAQVPSDSSAGSELES